MAYTMQTFVLLGIFISLGCALDPCYDIQDSIYGQIGNCIPRASCASGITVPEMCPSSGDVDVCCFDQNFPGREVRGAWVATVANIDWPITPGQSVAIQRETLTTLTNNLRDGGINAIYFQVRPHGDALYASPIEPWSKYLTGTEDVPPNPLWDPLEYLIEYAHSMDIEVHAWINPYRANMAANTVGLSPRHMAIMYPEYAYAYGTHLWMDPGAEIVQNRTYDVVIDLGTRYDLDGIHMDDYFYPYPVTGISFPDAATYNNYMENGGRLSRDNWRRDNVNRLVERVNIGLHKIKPYIKWSISPFGLYRAGHPEGMPRPIAGFDQYTQLFADPKLWLQRGWVDVLQPQLYWQISAPNQSYPQLLEWWVAQNTQGRHIYAGNFLSKVLEGWPISEFKEQAIISRENQHRSRGSWGNIQFSAKIFRDQASRDYFKTNIYPYPALQPTFPWLSENQPLPSPLVVTKIESIISWNNSDPSVHKVVIYKKVNQKWRVLKVLPKSRNEFRLFKGCTDSYAIAAIDRYGRESAKSFIGL